MDEQSYVVIIEGQPCVMDAHRALDAIDMGDCYHVEAIYRVNTDSGKLEELSIHGPWSDPKFPLYISVRDSKGSVVFDGHGTDH